MNFTALWAWRGSRRSCRRLGPEEERSPAAAMERKTLNTTASRPTTSITRCPPTCLRTPAAARHPRARDGSLAGALELPRLGRPPPLRRGRKMKMRPVRPRGPGHSPSHHQPPHPLLCNSFSRRTKVLTERQKGPVHLLPHQCPTRRRLPGPAEGPRLESQWRRRRWLWPAALQEVTTGERPRVP